MHQGAPDQPRAGEAARDVRDVVRDERGAGKGRVLHAQGPVLLHATDASRQHPGPPALEVEGTAPKTPSCLRAVPGVRQAPGRMPDPAGYSYS